MISDLYPIHKGEGSMSAGTGRTVTNDDGTVTAYIIIDGWKGIAATAHSEDAALHALEYKIKALAFILDAGFAQAEGPAVKRRKDQLEKGLAALGAVADQVRGAKKETKGN